METDDTPPPPAPAPADAASPAADAPPHYKRYNPWPKGFNVKAYRAMKRGKERKAYLLSFGKRLGLQTPENTSLTHTPAHGVTALNKEGGRVTNLIGGPKGMSRKEYFAKQPGKERQEFMGNYRRMRREVEPQNLVPQNFVWPKGMNQEEFLAKKPGKERMAYLARYIRNNDIELEETPARLRVPIGRQPEPRAHPRCGCSSSEACAACSRCVELHCVCGLTGRRRRALCQESRACSCSLTDPTARCRLCHGCRQPQGFSHCRCVLHQRLLWIKRHPELGMELTEEEEEEACNCYVLAYRHGGASATKDKEAMARKETERVRRIKRATGFPSSDSIYRSNKVTAFLGDEGLESDLDDGVDNGPGSEVLPPSTESVIPRTMTRRMLDPEYNPASYHPLFRSEGCSLLETIEPRGGRISRKVSAAFKSAAMQREICRGLENFSFELDRNAAMPPDDLVDFVVYMASIKSANVGELIGTFEDSAAVAASIVIQEYMAQLMEDTVKQRSLCRPTKASVQAFTGELLVGFNWQLFEQQHPFSPSEPMDKILSLVEKEATLKDTLADLILREFVSTQPKHFDVDTCGDDLSRWIRSVIDIPPFLLTGKAHCWSGTGMSDITEDQTGEAPSCANEKHQGNKAGAARSSRRIRLAVKANPVHGNPTYKLQFATTLDDGLHVQTAVGGLDSKIKAKATISQLAKVVELQERRNQRTLEVVPEAPRPPPILRSSPPEGPPEAPGPPPILRPSPPEDPNDPYASMFEHLRGHFYAYAQQKWKVAMDKYLSTTIPGWQTPQPEATAKRQSTGSPQSKNKKRRGASQ
ncbi:hypothetical protein PHYPSEUDO_005211 [Phytophthora pseudosyringae]|uniref:Uncharacterized protein n=1 Tax=Phytophthora pseudosyringae TaxID=221518 RepID=A0A8T1WB62_9STRA|nr:hypothetical protein PHYPSEUDO_005211 [Phytophthora pseudosyringae]